MPSAARVGDFSTHGGVCTGPGVATVVIGGQPAAVLMDLHTCAIPAPGHVPTVSPFLQGSASVLIGGRPAQRAGDTCGCGASVAVGCPTVSFG